LPLKIINVIPDHKIT